MVAWTSILLLASMALAAPNSLFERQNSNKLPDPFTFRDGSKVATQADWTRRQAEISSLFQSSELGDKPGKPTTLTATFSGTTLSITAGEAGKSITFTATVRKPSGAGPFPAIIAYGGASIPIPANVATITFNNDQMAAQQNSGSRGTGLFYNLYGSSHSAGALMAWAWGVSRIVDALEIVQATSGIDPKRVGVTGCSRNGKGAFVAGAFEPRIALTIPQESGAGGAACWRIADSEKAAGKNIQTASQIITENAWFSTRFNTFTTRTNTLPIDHHQLAGLVAPRGLYVPENNIDWLGPVATTGCMRVGKLIYRALGAADNMGFSLIGGHNHCQFPSGQNSELTAFINKFLLNGSGNTAVDRSTSNVQASAYIDWTAPTISSGGDGGSTPPTSPPPAASSAPPTTPPPTNGGGGGGGACVAQWGQCGGQSWTGGTSCCSGSCVASNQYYSQCR